MSTILDEFASNIKLMIKSRNWTKESIEQIKVDFIRKYGELPKAIEDELNTQMAEMDSGFILNDKTLPYIYYGNTTLQLVQDNAKAKRVECAVKLQENKKISLEDIFPIGSSLPNNTPVMAHHSCMVHFKADNVYYKAYGKLTYEQEKGYFILDVSNHLPSYNIMFHIPICRQDIIAVFPLFVSKQDIMEQLEITGKDIMREQGELEDLGELGIKYD